VSFLILIDPIGSMTMPKRMVYSGVKFLLHYLNIDTARLNVFRYEGSCPYPSKAPLYD